MKQKAKFKQTEIGLIPEDWEIDKIGEAILINPKRELKKGTEGKKVSMDKLNTFTKKITTFEITEFKGGTKFKNQDTLLARITPCLENGKTAFVDILDKNEVGFGSTEFLILSGKEKRTINEFVYYLAISQKFREQAISSMTGTSGRQRVQNDFLIDKLIALPPIQEQSAIAKILSDLDSKIELLQKQNETLEKIGQGIFKHWFVDFEFPNEEGKPYKSSGGEMVESELGEIPKGWRVGNYGELLEFERGIEPGSRNYLDKKEDNTLLFYRVGDLLSEDSTIYVKKEIIKNKIANKDNILVSFDGTVGRVKIGIEGSYSTGIRKVYSKDNLFTNGFIYFLMKSDFIQNKITEFAKGTTILHAGEAIKHFITVIPDNKIRTNFNIIAESTFEKLLININEIKNLQKTRDLLLPKLMTGKIRVPLEVEE